MLSTYHNGLNLCSSSDAVLYPELSPILAREINWELIRQQYDEIIKYTTALRTRKAEPQAIIKKIYSE